MNALARILPQAAPLVEFGQVIPSVRPTLQSVGVGFGAELLAVTWPSN